MARASRLTPQVRAGILRRVREGCHPVVAARAEGISKETFWNWRERAVADRGDDPDLAKMAMADLKTLAKTNQVAIPRRASREQVIASLEQAGICSWDSYREFFDQIDEADADAEASNVVALVNDTHNKPGDRLRFMERRWKERWAPVTAIEVTGKDGGPIVTREERIDRLASWLESVLDGEPLPEVAQGAQVVDVESSAPKALGE